MFQSGQFHVFDQDSHQCWTGAVLDFFDYGSYQHILISARGSRLSVFCGECSSYRWIFLPELEVGCSQAGFHDFFWNVERLSALIGRVDSLSVIFGLHFVYGGSYD